jgi:phytoene dehydrogenase-like protein
MTECDVIVVGAGCGGLSAGSLVAKEGRPVLVVEQGSRVVPELPGRYAV